jgi:hypothetical protein
MADSGCNGHFRDRQVSDRIQHGGGAGDDGPRLPLLKRIADPHHRVEAIDGKDPQRPLLPLLLQRLSPLHRRLLWHRCLR